MLSFSEWRNQQSTKPKPWKAKKDEILSFWQNLPNTLPVHPTNLIPPNHQGSTYKYDGIRVTGSSQFINSIISRLKNILPYNAGNSKLNVLYKQQVDKNNYPVPTSFVFYVQVKDKNRQKL